MGGRHLGKGFPKDDVVVGAQEFKSIINATDAEHTPQRKVLVQAFSAQNLPKQEPIIQDALGKFVTRLQEHAAAGTPLNIVKWFNFLDFDIVGELVFSESFGQLEAQNYHPWVDLICSHIKYSSLLICLRYFPPLDWLLPALAPARLKQLQRQFVQLAEEKVLRRLERDPSTLKHPDLISECKAKGWFPSDVSKEEIIGTFTLIIIAGSETTATVLGGVINYLCWNPESLKRLQKEIRDAGSDKRLTFASTAKLPYLNAVINEGMRLCAPVAGAIARIVPPEGAQICGHYVPGGTRVGIPPLSANVSATHFDQPHAFIPERWLQPKKDGFNHDANVLKPFSYGGRNCVGKNLALPMLRLILSRFLFHFDFDMESGVRWQEQRVHVLWEKEPLILNLRNSQSSMSSL